MSKNSSLTKRQRGVPRSSTGCFTCKARHLKCDEKRPACCNCLKSNRQCDGYTFPSSGPHQPGVKIIHWKPNALALHRMSADIAGEREERRAFHFFRSNSAGVFQGFFESEFWSRLIPQACHTDSAIKHAVIALGSLHQASLTGGSKMLDSGKTHDNFALQHCNKAITNLNQGLRGEGQKSIEILLMSCVIFVCFENLQGNYESALSHMESGIRMYRSWQAEQRKDACLGTLRIHDAIDKEIAQMICRLIIQTISFVDTHLLNTKWYAQNAIAPIDLSLDPFTSLNDARDRLDNCTSYIFESTMVEFFGNAHAAAGPPLDIRIHQRLLAQWLDAFQKLMQKSARSFGLDARKRAALIQAQYTAAKILVDTGISPQETVFDAFIPEFASIVALMSSVLESEQGSGTKSQFSFDTGIVPRLYFTSTRCRDPSIRRRALSMLTSLHRREGIWDSDMVAKIAERMITIEEERVDQVTSSSDIVATARLSVLNATIYSDQRRVLLELCRPTRNENGEWDLLDEWIEY